MPEFDDFDLLADDTPRSTGSAPPPDLRDRPNRTSLLLGVGAVLAIAGLVYFLYTRRTPSATTAEHELPRQTAAPAAPSPSPLGSQPVAVDVPPLDESDPVVRTLVRMLSTNPEVLKWLATDGLIRNFTVVVDNIANGRAPVKQVQVLKPAGVFRVQRQGGALRVDPSSYARYDALAGAVASVDAQAAARVYATLEPRLDEASRELGTPGSFDRTLEAAIVRLTQTRVDLQDQPLEMKGAEGYRYADAEIESLSSAQKLLIRMGPKNARMVQAKLREIGLALGMAPERLR